MGKKRRNEDKEERIRRKIRKLQQKLDNQVPNCVLEDEFNGSANALEEAHSAQITELTDGLSPRDSSWLGWPVSPHSDDDTLYYVADTPYDLAPGTSQPAVMAPTPLVQDLQPDDPAPDPSRLPEVTSQPLPSNDAPPTLQNEVIIVDLEDDILAILGDAPKPEAEFGPNIHRDVAARWQDILGKGLSKEVKDKMVKDYLIPANCEFLTPPILNPEAKAALPEHLVKRDFSLLAKQKQLAVAISALAQATEMIISKETNLQKILKPISDASRLLCDSHHIETKTRRSFVISSINLSLKDTLIETSRDKFLFGNNVTEKLKAAKTIARSGESLKQQRQFNKNNFNSNKDKFRNRLNPRALHLKTTGRFDVGPPRNAARQQPTSRPPHPPPPPRRAGRSPPRQMQPPRRPYPPRR